jgi:transcriptional regulator with XRE-family HTH domain
MTLDSEPQTFASWLRAAMRQREGLKIRQLEAYSGVSRSNISEYLRGRILPSMETVVRLARFFAADESRLLQLVSRDRAGRRPPSPVGDESRDVQYVDLARVPESDRRKLRRVIEMLVREWEAEDG